MGGLLETLIRPDSEEDPESALIARAANILEVGEVQFLQLAYREWFGEDVAEEDVDSLFEASMIRGKSYFWARHFARRIIELYDAGKLNVNEPRFHRFDYEYRVETPLDALRVVFALGVVAMMVTGGIAISRYDAGPNAPLFPPYITDKELKP